MIPLAETIPKLSGERFTGLRKLNVYAAESLRKLDVNFKFQQDSVKIPQCGNLIFHPVMALPNCGPLPSLTSKNTLSN